MMTARARKYKEPAMYHYTRGALRRNKYDRQHKLRSLRRHGPRYVKGRRSTRYTSVWTLRPRRLNTEVPA